METADHREEGSEGGEEPREVNDADKQRLLIGIDHWMDVMFWIGFGVGVAATVVVGALGWALWAVCT